ncbi:MAG: gluconokinase [Chloroflexota bacterium]
MTTLIIDMGSSSIRALLFDAHAQAIPGALARRAHRFSAEATADPVALRRLVEACIDDVMAHPAAGSTVAVGMATFVSNLTGLDADGAPATPLYTYADTASSPDADSLRRQADQTATHARTGCRIHPAYHPAKLHRLRQTQPDLFARVSRWTDFATYCYATWFGRDVPCSYSVASWSGLLDRHALTWDGPWLDRLGLTRDHLPPLADFDAAQRGLDNTYARRWPALRAAPFFLAVGDGAAANIGSGGGDPAHPVLTIGTTAALRVVDPAPGPVPLALWAYRVDAARHLIGGATSEGGNVFAWARDTLKLETDAIDAVLLKRAPGAHGLTALPLFAGERSPGYHAGATAALHGLRLTTTPLDIVHALLEGVALRLRLIYDHMGRPGDAVLAGGGALTGSAGWAQIVSDVLDVPLHLTDMAEATAAGVALLIARRTPRPTITRTVSPRPGSAEPVAALLDRQAHLYARLLAEG